MSPKRYVNPPSPDDERELLDTLDNGSSPVSIRNRTFRFRPLTGFAQRKLTRILLRKDGVEQSVSCKCLAAARLNGFFSLALWWPLLWRWYYYIRQYTEDELTPAVLLIKKKVPLTAYLTNTTLWIAMRETMMQMNRNEVFLSLRERSGDNDGSSAASGNGSRSPSAS